METSTKELLKAAQIVATCKPERLELVLQLLKENGFNVSDDLIQKAILRNHLVEKAEALYRKNKREGRFHKKWLQTNNPVILSLRNAYLSDYRIADIAKVAGLPRTALYEIMSGHRNFRDETADALIHAYSVLNIPYPPESVDEE